MDPRTEAHLQVVRRNRDLARSLCNQDHLQPDPWEWVVVMAFYAAVHAVNAYLWERYAVSPKIHGERTYGVHHDAAIQSCAFSYDVLRNVGYHARYSEGFAISEQDARDFLHVEFRAVEATEMQALGQPAPNW